MWMYIAAGITGTVAVIWAVAAALRSNKSQAIFDTQRLDTQSGYTAANMRLRHMVGEAATAVTDLRPYGTGAVHTEQGDIRIDAHAKEEYLYRGTALIVTGVEDNVLIVKKLPELSA